VGTHILAYFFPLAAFGVFLSDDHASSIDVCGGGGDFVCVYVVFSVVLVILVMRSTPLTFPQMLSEADLRYIEHLCGRAKFPFILVFIRR